MFDLTGLQVNRGTFNSEAGGDVVSIEHSYKSITDTIAQISAPGYFPPNFGTVVGNIENLDTIVLVGTDTFATAQVTNVLTGTVTIPVADFPGGIVADVYNGTSPTSLMKFGPNQTVPIQIGSSSPTNEVVIPSVLLVNEIDSVLRSNTLMIGPTTLNPINIGSASVPILAVGGVSWNFGVGGSILSYQRQVISSPTMWTGAFASPTPGTIVVEVFNGTEVRLSFKTVIAAGAATPQFITTGVVIPAFARPLSPGDATCTTTVIANDIQAFGTVYLSNSGAFVIANGPSTVLNTFGATAGNNGFRAFSMGYTLSL